jgi:hypothetical protein
VRRQATIHSTIGLSFVSSQHLTVVKKVDDVNHCVFQVFLAHLVLLDHRENGVKKALTVKEDRGATPGQRAIAVTAAFRDSPE